MRYYEGSNTFNFSWDKVVKAYWCRYPNPLAKHVLSEDVVERFVDNQGRLLTKRLLTKNNKLPKWLERLMSARSVYIVEESVVDPKNRTFTTLTKNIGMQNIMIIEEKVVYRQSLENDEWTLAEKQASFKSSVFGLSRPVEAFSVERFRHNATKASRGFQLVLDAMYNPQTANLDMSSVGALHPLLTERLREKAKTLSDKAKSKAVPMMAAAISGEKH